MSGGDAEADVFVGFMDEEVAPILRGLPRHFSKRPVFVIERATGSYVRQGMLFEKPLGYYGLDQAQLTLLRTSSPPLNDPSIEGRLARAVGARLPHQHLQTLLSTAVGAKRKTTRISGGREVIDPDLLIIRISRDDDRTASPVILVRSPEMGVQAALVQEYLRGILAGIGTALEGMSFCIHSYGAGGTVARGWGIGSWNRILGSVFVGAHVVPLQGHQAAVRLAGGNGRATPVAFFQGQPVAHRPGDVIDEETVRARVNADAQARFCASTPTLVSTAGLTLGQEIQGVLGSYEAAQSRSAMVSLTVSTFAGRSMKNAGRSTHARVGDVNMEDHHLFVASSAVVTTERVRVERVNTDPSRVRPWVEDLVRRAALETRLSEREYVDALMWGLQGCPLSAAPDAAQLAGFNPGARSYRRFLVAVPRTNGTPIQHSMFYGELATDFLPEILARRALRQIEEYYGSTLTHHPAVQALVGAALKALAPGLAEAGSRARRSFQEGNVTQTRTWLEELVSAIRYFDVSANSIAPETLRSGLEFVHPNGPFLPLSSGGFRVPIFWDESRKAMKIWARAGRGGAFSVDRLTIGETDVDRILYKGSNRPLLEMLAPSFIRRAARRRR